MSITHSNDFHISAVRGVEVTPASTFARSAKTPRQTVAVTLQAPQGPGRDLALYFYQDHDDRRESDPVAAIDELIRALRQARGNLTATLDAGTRERSRG